MRSRDEELNQYVEWSCRFVPRVLNAVVRSGKKGTEELESVFETQTHLPRAKICCMGCA